MYELTNQWIDLRTGIVYSVIVFDAQVKQPDQTCYNFTHIPAVSFKNTPPKIVYLLKISIYWVKFKAFKHEWSHNFETELLVMLL